MFKSSVIHLAPGGITYNKATLQTKVYKEESDHVIEGILYDPNGDNWYPIIDGVPCFFINAIRSRFKDFCIRHDLNNSDYINNVIKDVDQTKTIGTFSDKWLKFTNYGMEPEHKDFLLEWGRKKLGLESVGDIANFYKPFSKILEVGPGSGFNTQFMAENCNGNIFSLDISEAAFTTFNNTRHLSNCIVIQADLMDAPFIDHYFDFINADGVLHHTSDTKSAVFALFKKLKPGGKFFFYIYRKMGPARQFCDKYKKRTFRLV